MSETAQPERKAWQPFTPQGVARFAHAYTNRLLVIQLISAFIVAASLVWFLGSCYSPVILEAIQKLPDEAKISQQELKGLPPGALAEGRFLSIGVEGTENPFSGVGDIQIRLGPTLLNICSLMGCLEVPYPKGWMVSLARSSVEPRWGAWKPMLLAGIGLAVMLYLMAVWVVLGFILMWVPKLIAFYADRQVTWLGSFKIACAAHLPGALFTAFIIVLYGLGALDLIRFLILFAVHLPIGWVYLLAAPIFLPKHPEKAVEQKNPFGGS